MFFTLWKKWLFWDSLGNQKWHSDLEQTCFCVTRVELVQGVPEISANIRITQNFLCNMMQTRPLWLKQGKDKTGGFAMPVTSNQNNKEKLKMDLHNSHSAWSSQVSFTDSWTFIISSCIYQITYISGQDKHSSLNNWCWNASVKVYFKIIWSLICLAILAK